MDMSLFTSFEGRINRQKWWLGLIILFVLEWIVFIILGMFLGGPMRMAMEGGDPAAMETMSGGMMTAVFILLLVFLWPGLALYAKRWHDRGKSGWWTLIILVPIIGSIWALVECGFLRGTEGANAYGPDPLAGSQA